MNSALAPQPQKDSGEETPSPIVKGESVPHRFPLHASAPTPAVRPGLVVGLSGPLGSGKSTLCADLVHHGADSISGDEVGHQLLEGDAELRRNLAETFGPDLLDSEGKLDRAALAKRAFASPVAVRKLNRMTHPPLVARLRDHVREHRRRAEGILVVDAALIPEWGIESEMDLLVHVTAPRDQRVARWCRARELTPGEFERRERCQLSEPDKRRHAHVIVHNAGDVRKLHRKAEALWDLLKNIEAGSLRLTKRVEL